MPYKMLTTDGGVEKILMRDLKGRLVRTRHELQNGNMRIPAGSSLTVAGAWRSGLTLESKPCPHCGVHVYITRVPREWLELFPVTKTVVLSGSKKP